MGFFNFNIKYEFNLFFDNDEIIRTLVVQWRLYHYKWTKAIYIWLIVTLIVLSSLTIPRKNISYTTELYIWIVIVYFKSIF